MRRISRPFDRERHAGHASALACPSSAGSRFTATPTLGHPCCLAGQGALALSSTVRVATWISGRRLGGLPVLLSAAAMSRGGGPLQKGLLQAAFALAFASCAATTSYLASFVCKSACTALLARINPTRGAVRVNLQPRALGEHRRVLAMAHRWRRVWRRGCSLPQHQLRHHLAGLPNYGIKKQTRRDVGRGGPLLCGARTSASASSTVISPRTNFTAASSSLSFLRVPSQNPSRLWERRRPPGASAGTGARTHTGGQERVRRWWVAGLRQAGASSSKAA